MSVLFVGNGINRYAETVPGWGELFAKAVNIDGFEVKHSLTPTLEYELNIRNAFAKDNQKTADVIKKDIAAYLMRKQTDAAASWEQKIHIPLLQNAPQIILTTNYDYFLELAADPNFKAGPASTREWLYSKERYRDVPGHRIYHIHGEISVPSSICLGFEHYVGSIQFIRAELTRSTSEKMRSPQINYHRRSFSIFTMFWPVWTALLRIDGIIISLQRMFIFSVLDWMLQNRISGGC